MPHPLFETFGIREDSFKEIRNRIYVVGKFNGENDKKGPYLFSKNNRQDDYHYLPSRCQPLTYDAFLSALDPSLTEKHDTKRLPDSNQLDYFELLCQTGNMAGEKISINESNYFFQRATSSSLHPKFKKSTPSLRDIINYKKGVQDDSSSKVGEGIYVQVRKSLKDFCTFQTRNMEIIAAVSNLIAANTDTSGIPFFRLGQLLPVNFVPVLMDYLYEQEDNTFDKRFDNIDFKADIRNNNGAPISTWRDAWENDSKEDFRKSFVELITWFKNYLLNPLLLKSFNSLRKLKYREVLNSDRIAEELRKEFLKSRDSFNVLNQIIKSKVLLSMILSWAIDWFETLPKDPNLTPNEKAEAIDAIIFNGCEGVAAPDQTFKDEYNQKSAKQIFQQYLPIVLTYVADKVSVAGTAAFAALPDALKAKAAEIEADEQKKKTVKDVREQEQKGDVSIISTIENIIVDDLFSEMFKQPGLSLSGLKDRMEKLQNDLFLTSSILKVTRRDDNRKLLTKKLAEGINRNPGANMSLDEDASAPSSGALDKKSRIQESNFNKLLSNGVDVLIDILNDKEINANRKGVLTAIRNREIIEKLELSNSDLLLSNYIPLLPPDPQSRVAKLNTTVTEPLVMAIMNKVSMGDPIHLKKLLKKAIEERKKMDEQYIVSEFEQALSNYLDDKTPANFSTVKSIVADDIRYFNENLALLYETYNKADHLDDFKNRLETTTLAKLLMLEKEALGLEGSKKPGTNLLDMLLDLVEQLDSSNPNLADFFAKNSLTRYIPKEIFREGIGGYDALKTVLDRQSNKSLDNIVQYVSELQGLRYLFDYVKTGSVNAEIVLLNFDHSEFIDWLKDEHNQPIRFLNPVNLTNASNDPSQFPCCIIMSELAFGNTGAADSITNKTAFLKNSQNSVLYQKKPKSIQIIPPIVLAAGSADIVADFDWDPDLLNNSMAPIILIEPSLPLNDRNDIKFPTILSTSYLFAAQLLVPFMNQTDLIGPQNVNKVANGRVRVIGDGAKNLSDHLREIINPEIFKEKEAYAFDADYFLFLITLLRTAIKDNKEFDYEAFMNYFLYDEFNNRYKMFITMLDDLLISSKMSDWSLNTAFPFNKSSTLNGVSYTKDMKEKKTKNVFDQTQWFTKQSLLFNF